ncbi:flagellar hook-associated protein FlgL [Desulfosporosinus meridiei]|uniref:Flagellar hook-associated protein 3 n=1 Tax=Desulfosporosinus meridiei (strain ATCC BAA-275 / DSM 13257 / KCTC 12902 / NCIMB 13706 / S10) TaxID=768704 RepID=J7J3A0_DESMD|nr:flagellar hook-associated protein FlgL [Desulfosporosinus meridiei]AFQ45768.1 flagellar hook-associated protein 3 [Desulfosporosinus meridiei DSM 13257]
MRITNNTISSNFLGSLNRSLEKSLKIQTQLADGKALHAPSDDPIKAVRSLRYSTSMELNNQYTQNAEDALSWMNTTDDDMQDLSSIMISIKEQVIKASNGTNPQSAVQAIGDAVDNLINQMINIGNSQLGGRYIFAGQNDKTTPFIRDGDTITYNGDNQKISMPIHPGISTPSQDSVNLTGEDVFGPNLKILNDLIDIKNHLKSGSLEDQEWLSETGLALLEDDHSSMLQSHTELGARMSMYEMAKNMLDGSNTIIAEDQANNDYIDVAKGIIDYKNAENVYKMALQIGASIMPMSLADFLR